MNPFASDAASIPVVTETVRAPAVALAATVIDALKLVALTTVMEFTVMPAPKVAWLVPWTKLVNWPVIATVKFAWPCCPAFGVTWVMMAVPPPTVNPLARLATSAPVVTVTACGPAAAFPAIEMEAVKLAGLEMVTVPTVMPAPKLTWLVP